MKSKNPEVNQKNTNFLDNPFQDKMKLHLQNCTLLQYQRELNQNSLDFVLNNDRASWKISDVDYMELLNYYIEQRTKINHQLSIYEKKYWVLEIHNLYLSMQEAKSKILRVHALLAQARSSCKD